jgi:hypothetical protein
LLTAVLIIVVATTLPARQTPQSQIIENGSGLPADIGRQVVTPYQQFANKLKLDGKTQAPAAEQVFTETAREAGPIGQQMMQLRQRLLNDMLSKRTEDVKPALEAYTEAAAKMTGLEVKAFTKVYEALKPNQQSGGPQAFAAIAGVFQPASPGGGRRGGRGGAQ